MCRIFLTGTEGEFNLPLAVHHIARQPIDPEYINAYPGRHKTVMWRVDRALLFADPVQNSQFANDLAN